MKKKRVLFLCTGNSARSQMAEAFLRKYAGDRYEVHSAGLEPKGLNPLTVRVMEEAGIDLAGHTSKDLETYLGKMTFDHLVTVCDDADQNCPTFPGAAARRHWSFEDPARQEGNPDEKLAKFREVRDRIEQRVRQWAAEQETPGD